MCDLNFLCSHHAACCARFLFSSPYFVAEFSLLIRYHSLRHFCAIAAARFPHCGHREVRPIGSFSFCRTATRVLSLRCLNCQQGALPMEWTTPQHEEIDLNCEISSYANAEL